MNEVYYYLGYSKQSFHQKLNRWLKMRELEGLLLPLIRQYREDHPGVASRELYLLIQPNAIGRDKFEQLCFRHGFKLGRIKSYRRTTDSNGVIRFENLIEGKEFNAINQVWVSDITYYEIKGEFFYITFIMDLFSRRILSANVSNRLLTSQTTLPALRKALLLRRPAPGLIFHSDGGGQYYCKEFTKLTSAWEIKNSMAEEVYENPHAERINGTIKNQYLKGYNPQNFESLKQMTAKAVLMYNEVKKHSSLGKRSPVEFEKSLSADGTLLLNDIFGSDSNKSGQRNQKYHLSARTIVKPKKENIKQQSVKKTVNVI